MAKRQIRDSHGNDWDVWEVIPDDVLGGFAYDRRRDRTGKRVQGDGGLSLDPILEDGWLCFQAGATKRRFAPIPPGWTELPDGVLRVLLDIATPVGSTVNGTSTNAASGS